MPNWVRNIVRMKGIADKSLFIEAEGRKVFDFNKLIPMPESLGIESGSMTNENIIYYLTERCTIPVRRLSSDKVELLNKLSISSLTDNWSEEVFHRVMARAFDESEEERQRRYDSGKIYVSNFQTYGATTWYGWCCAHWGTKWNACDTEIIDADTISFNTAWSNPDPILHKLAEMYPDAEIEHWWADEDMGSNTGYRKIHGVEWFEDRHELDDRALELYAKCWGEDSDCLYRDDNGVLRRRKCEECHRCD